MNTNIDYSEDLKTLQKFTDAFEIEYKDKFGIEIFRTASPREYVKYGADKIYKIANPKNFVNTNYNKNISSSLLWLTSSINPNGITDSTDIGRTYTIQFEVKCLKRLKLRRTWNEDYLVKFYGYGRTINEIMAKFKAWTEKEEIIKLYFK